MISKEIEGYFQILTNDKHEPIECFISNDFDIETISELINCFGYIFDSIVGLRVRIIIEEIEEITK